MELTKYFEQVENLRDYLISGIVMVLAFLIIYLFLITDILIILIGLSMGIVALILLILKILCNDEK